MPYVCLCQPYQTVHEQLWNNCTTEADWSQQLNNWTKTWKHWQANRLEAIIKNHIYSDCTRCSVFPKPSGHLISPRICFWYFCKLSTNWQKKLQIYWCKTLNLHLLEMSHFSKSINCITSSIRYINNVYGQIISTACNLYHHWSLFSHRLTHCICCADICIHFRCLLPW